MINLFKVRMSSDVGDEVAKVLKSGYVGQGPKVEEFEAELQKHLKSKTVPVTVNSCTAAIDLALELSGVEYGSEVIATPQTCWASNCNIVNRGAIIRWADIDPITGNIDPNSVKNLITEKTKAIVAVNWGGKICDFKTLKSFGVPVIEDAAHTWDVFNVFYRGLERGNYICYSFQAIKYLTTGDGGCLICENEVDVEKAKLLRWFGLDRTKGASFRCTQNIQFPGHKYHMNDIAAQIGLCNLDEAFRSVIKQRINSKFLIDNIKNQYLTISSFDVNSSYWLFSIIVKQGKDKFISYLKENEIESSQVHYRNDEYDCTKSFKEDILPGVDLFSETHVCIPNGWWLTDSELDHIVKIVNDYVY